MTADEPETYTPDEKGRMWVPAEDLKLGPEYHRVMAKIKAALPPTPEDRAAIIWEDTSYIGTTGEDWRDWLRRKLAEQIRAAETAAVYEILGDVKVSVRNDPRGRRVWIDIENGGYNLGPDDWTLHPVLRWWERVRKLLPEAKP